MIDEEYLLYLLLESQIGPKNSSYLGNILCIPMTKNKLWE
jgi:hypothetical protein